MVADAGVEVLLTGAGIVAGLPALAGAMVCVDSDWAVISKQSGENPICRTTAENLAYVIYTSGSTGEPKGVMVSHAGFTNLLQSQTSTFKLHPRSRVLQFASASFDASVFELCMALCSGAALCLARTESLRPGQPLLSLLQRHAISIVTLPPSTLAVLPPTELPYLQTIITAGETCPAELVQRWGGGRQFFNAYGPTEATIWATVEECELEERRPTIGRPIANTEVYVLDERREAVGIGVAGELYIGGVGLARGYMRRADLTAERFSPHPFSKQPGARLYRTGDVVRWRGNGKLDFIGRVDEQVKVRGYRIELGEIEAVLRRHARVRECVVIAQADEIRDRRLVAYIVSRDEEVVSTSEMRRHLAECLPEYMIPSIFVPLESLPLTPNGKVDKQALPGPEHNRPELTDSYQAPRSPIEEVLCGIWGEVLRVEQVGIHDDFFELGGHSLLATQVVSRIREVLQVEVPLRSLFESRTLANMAETILQNPAERDRVERVSQLLASLNKLSAAEFELMYAEEHPTGTQEGLSLTLALT
jgi:amino acid adenylation domain-containing protein